MAVSLKHAFASAKADSADPTLVNASNWNAEHTLTLATDKLLGRVSSGTGAAEEVTFTDFAQSLLDDADAATAQATLGLVIGTNVQAWDADLDTIAGLAKTDNNFIVGNGSAWTVESGATARTSMGAAASGGNTDITSVYLDNTGLKVKDTNASHGLIIAPGSNITADRTLTLTTGDADRTLDISAGSVTISTAGAALIDDASASDQRTTLGLVIGTNVQAYDAELAALAGLTSAANTIPTFTGSGTAGLITLGASELAGRGSTGNATNIALGSGLSMSGATLSASGGVTYIDSVSTTSGATVSKTDIAAYKILMCVFDGVSHNDGSIRAFRVAVSDDNGSTYGTAFTVTETVNASTPFYGTVFIYRADQAATNKVVLADQTFGGTETVETGVVNALRFSPAAGSFDAGSIQIWGFK